MQNTINFALGTIAFTAAFSVLLHDTQIDRAATAAISAPVAALGYAAADIKSKMGIKAGEAHVHVERVSLSKISGLRSTLPRIDPRDGDRNTKKQNKVAFLGSNSAETIWPSV